MYKFVAVGLLVAMVACQALGAAEDSWYGKPEDACLSQGGRCILASECLQPIGETGELCPKQAAQGIQCCLGLPQHERRCRMHGGACYKKGYCHQRVVYGDASDCGAAEECCILE